MKYTIRHHHPYFTQKSNRMKLRTCQQQITKEELN
jgi:hypothetical protein